MKSQAITTLIIMNFTALLFCNLIFLLKNEFLKNAIFPSVDLMTTNEC